MRRIRIAQTVLLTALSAALGQVGAEAFLQTRTRPQEATREQRQRIPDIFSAMGVGPGSVVADIGAGQGFFTVRLARAVGETGRVFAVDISQSALRGLRRRVEEEGLRNVQVIEGAVDNPHLPESSLDAALIVNAYHEMTEHQAMLDRIRRALKPTGRLVIVEPIAPARRDAPRNEQTRQHEIAPEYVRHDARDAGFAVAGLEDPFSDHGHGSEYLMVLTPGTASSFAPSADHVSKSPVEPSAIDIRIPFEQFLPVYEAGKVVVLDVRDDASCRRGHIPGARLAPLSALRDLVPELKRLQVPIVAYCSCPAEETSSRAVLYLRRRGVLNARALVGGFDAWETAGRKIEHGR